MIPTYCQKGPYFLSLEETDRKLNEQLAKSPGFSTRATFNDSGNILCVPGSGEGRLHQPRLGSNDSYRGSGPNITQNDSGLMEKKVTKKFYLLSCINVISAVILGWGNPMDIAVMIAILIALVANHTVLVKLIGTLVTSMSEEKTGSPLKRIFGLMAIKMTLLGGSLVLAYLYNQDIVPKVMLLMIFQLIIQVVSIKNNY